MGKVFYLNLSIALNRGISAQELSKEKEVYQKFKHEPRFLNLIQRYGIDIEEILK